jgi:hypothetical protein
MSRPGSGPLPLPSWGELSAGEVGAAATTAPPEEPLATGALEEHAERLGLWSGLTAGSVGVRGGIEDDATESRALKAGGRGEGREGGTKEDEEPSS